MPYMIVRHKAQDFAKWKQAFDEHADSRKAAGSQGGKLFRSADDPQELIVVLEWKDQGSARQFANSEDLRQAMERAGVSDQPDIYFVDEVDRPAS